jgi:cytochrome c-type biogenesis protein CcmH
MTFWLISLAIAALAALPLALALLRRGDGEQAARFDLQVYRDQLREVDRDLARGVVTEDEAEQIRTEVSRRLLEADRTAQTARAEYSGAPMGLSFAVSSLVVAGIVAGAYLLYAQIGAPGYPDLPLKTRIELAEHARLNRPAQTEAEAQSGSQYAPLEEPDANYLALVEQLRTAVTDRPEDLQGHRLLARHEASLGNFPAAYTAQARVNEILGDQATAADMTEQADLMVLAAGGYVSPETEAILRRILELDPGNGTARYYSGLLAAQTGRPDVAFRIWRALLESSAPDAPWIPTIRTQIEGLAQMAGVDYVLPTQGRGPSEADISAAEDMSPEDRMEMIRNMVSGLSERLATEGGPPQDWARLIRAYGVLGNREAAAAIWAEAQDVFPDDAARVVILQSARDAGVAQ